MSTFEQVTGGVNSNLKDAKLLPGDVVTTKGYYSPGDGGGATYLVFANGTVTPDGYADIALANGNVASLQDTDGNVKKYGAKEGTDSTAAIQSAIDRDNRYYVPSDLTVFCINLAHGDDTIGVIDGTLKLPDNSGFWTQIISNKDTVNGNTNINLSGSGVLDGNAANQTKIGQYLIFFYKCSDCNISIRTLKNNFGPDPYTGTTPPNHPLGPFDFGVPYGDQSFTNPFYSAVMFVAGSNNHVRNFELLNWGREGIFHWFGFDSSVTDFVAISGPETENEYYEDVQFDSLNLTANVSVGDNVHVNDSHTAGGQPWLIYKSLVSGTLDLTTEDYSDVARWTLVERDTTLDYGYTSARSGGGGSFGNLIDNGVAKFCRASGFSIDSVESKISNVFSYHNSFQVGINFGHDKTPASGSVGTNLISVNAGWKGGLTGASYGINIVGASERVTVSNFTVVGAGRAGVNVSSNGNTAIISDGNIRYSAAQGINTFAAGSVLVSNVRATNNVSGDFVAGSGSTLRLVNCEDTNGPVANHQIDENNVSRGFELKSRDAKVYTALRGLFSVPASSPIASITFDNTTSNDNMVLRVAYSERNTGSGTPANQYVVEENVLVSGGGGARTISVLNTTYAQLRAFRYTWASGVLNIYLTDIAGPTDVLADAQSNSLFIEAKTNSNSNVTIDIG